MITAKELVDKFKPHTKQFDARFGWADDKEAAKQCALIVVEEIHKALHGVIMKQPDSEGEILSAIINNAKLPEEIKNL